MSLQLFKSRPGFSDANIDYLSGTGAPGGDGSYQDAAGVGSQYADASAGEHYRKVAAGAGTDKWHIEPKMSDIDALASGISWREPVHIYDDVHADTAAAIADMDADDLIQGVTVVADMRLLLNGISSSPNVYIVGGSTGAWTLTEDTNEESAGDAVKVISGDNSKKEFQFDGTTWRWIGEDSDSEDIAIRDFIGKGSAGAVATAYTEQNYVTNGDSILVSQDKLDIQMKVSADIITASNTAAGFNADGTLVAFSGTSYMDAASSHQDALVALDTQLASVAATGSSAESTNVTTQTSVDSFLADDYLTAEWLVIVYEEGTPANRYSGIVHALHDGTDSADATTADFNEKSILEFATEVTGLDIDVDVSGTGAAQEVQLLVTATNPVTVKVSRRHA